LTPFTNNEFTHQLEEVANNDLFNNEANEEGFSHLVYNEKPCYGKVFNLNCLVALNYAAFNFHSYDFHVDKKEFIYTKCKHIFHSNCLEKWLLQKKECPNCRKTIEL